MSVDNHTPLSTGAAAQAATFNSVFSQLDAAIKKNNYAATGAPTTGDDTADGYTVGSRWIDVTNDRAYVAVDVTLGAAVWKEMSFPAAVTQNFGVTGVLTVTGTEAINTSGNNNGLAVTRTGASSASLAGQIEIAQNDGTAMEANERLGQINFSGHNGTSAVASVQIIASATETWSGTARGSKIVFYTVPNTTTSITIALTLEQNQNANFAGDVGVASGKVYKVNNTQVVAARSTGWTAPTATQSKAGFGNGATSTQIEQNLSAVINALITHGLLGA